MKVAQLAKELGVSADTVRYYTRTGFLSPAKSPDNGYKSYSTTDRKRLRFILSARQLGFSVADIGAIFSQSDKGSSPCILVRELIAERLKEHEKILRNSQLLHRRMTNAVKQWQKKPENEPSGSMICHLIEDFVDEH